MELPKNCSKEDFRVAFLNNKDILAAQLCTAVSLGWKEAVLFLLDDCGADINCASLHDGCTPLLAASRILDLEMVQLLIERGSETYAVDKLGNTPLGYAIQKNDQKLIDYLVANGAHTYKEGDSLQSQLCKAADEGNLEAIMYLVNNEGVSLDEGDYDKRTALHVSACSGHVDVVKFILEKGAMVNAQDRWGNTAYSEAVYSQNQEMITLLKLHGGEMGTGITSTAVNSDFFAAVHENNIEKVTEAIDHGADIVKCRDYGNRTPLHVAAGDGHLDMVKFLVDKKSDVNALCHWNNTPSAYAFQGGHDETFEYLTSVGGVLAKDPDQSTLKLCEASNKGDVEKVKSILTVIKDPNLGDYDNRTALHLASANGNMEVVRILLEAGCNPNALDRWGHTPLGEAKSNNHKGVMDLLRDHGANFNSSQMEDKNAKLCAAAASGKLHEIINIIKEDADADINVQDYDHRTPLHLAASEGHEDVIQYLIEQGANVNAEDRWGGTPYSDAIKYCHSAAASALSGVGGKMGSVGNDSLWKVNPDKIKFLDLIAEGFQGATWKAEWRGLTVAVKKVKADHFAKDVWKLFNNEIDLLTRVRHPNLVMFLGACIHINQPILIEEFMLGGSLQALLDRHHVRQTKLSNGKLMKFAHDIALGINYLHTYNPPIVHRDLTPSNLLLSKYRDSIKVADFGFGKFLPEYDGNDSEVYAMTGGLGSLRYMCPEILNHTDYNFKVDVYSYAMVVCYMATGQRPFSAVNPVEAAKRVAVDDTYRPHLGGVSVALKPLLSKCWAQNPDDRPMMQEVLDNFDNYSNQKQERCSIS